MGKFSASQLQHASNQVGVLFANSILDSTLDSTDIMNREKAC